MSNPTQLPAPPTRPGPTDTPVLQGSRPSSSLFYLVVYKMRLSNRISSSSRTPRALPLPHAFHNFPASFTGPPPAPTPCTSQTSTGQRVPTRSPMRSPPSRLGVSRQTTNQRLCHGLHICMLRAPPKQMATSSRSSSVMVSARSPNTKPATSLTAGRSPDGKSNTTSCRQRTVLEAGGTAHTTSAAQSVPLLDTPATARALGRGRNTFRHR